MSGKEQLEEVAKNLERFLRVQLIKEWSYKELLELISTELVGLIVKRKRKINENPKVWWKKEVEQDIKGCHKASNIHRKI